jgi:DNA modification methylase
VLDIFSGSGTTGEVALKHGRDYIGLDLGADYLDLAVARIEGREAPDDSDDDRVNILDILGEP